MQAGRELDDLVAQHVMGWELETVNIMISNYWKNENGFICYPRHFRPSEDIKDAWEVVKKLKGPDMWIGIDTTPDGRYRCMMLNKKGPDADFIADSAPWAICLAALKTVGVDIEKAV